MSTSDPTVIATTDEHDEADEVLGLGDRQRVVGQHEEPVERAASRRRAAAHGHDAPADGRDHQHEGEEDQQHRGQRQTTLGRARARQRAAATRTRSSSHAEQPSPAVRCCPRLRRALTRLVVVIRIGDDVHVDARRRHESPGRRTTRAAAPAARRRRLAPRTSCVAFSAWANDTRPSAGERRNHVVHTTTELFDESPLLRRAPRRSSVLSPSSENTCTPIRSPPTRPAIRAARRISDVAARPAGDADDDSLACLPGLADPVGCEVRGERFLDSVGDPQQGQFAQRAEVAGPEVVVQRGVDAIGRVDVAVGHAPAQRLRGHVDQFDLIGAAHDGVGHGLALRRSGDLD